MYILTLKAQFEILTLGQVKWPDLINDNGGLCCISVDASWQDKHNDNSPAVLRLFCEKLLM